MRQTDPILCLFLATACVVCPCPSSWAQPDLARWSTMVGDFEHSGWVSELEALEPGCILALRSPELNVGEWPTRSPWADTLVLQLEALPEADHHADRALERILEQGMRLFQLVEAQADRHRPGMETILTESGLPEEWALLPMVLTGWDVSYYGPGRRAGAWAVDLPTALSMGLDVRRGWDERHVEEKMNPAMATRIQEARRRFPDSPLQQVLDVVRGPRAARDVDVHALDADLLGWLHLLRVWLQVDRNFKRDRLTALWALREKSWTTMECPDSDGHAHFRALGEFGFHVRDIRRENPWYTTDSIGWSPLRQGLRIPVQADQESPERALERWCLWAPQPGVPDPTHVHVVQAGEVLGTIARRYGVRIADIQEWNGLSNDLIRVGQPLTLKGVQPEPDLTMRETVPEASPAGPFRWHEVQAGESYWTIAAQYAGVDLEALLSINDVAPADLQPGMRLRIPLD